MPEPHPILTPQETKAVETTKATNWRNACEVGQKSEREWWLRWTDVTGMYWWYHPATGWVTEPHQKMQPTFATRSEAYWHREQCPVPPSLLDTAEDQPTPPAPAGSGEIGWPELLQAVGKAGGVFVTQREYKRLFDDLSAERAARIAAERERDEAKKSRVFYQDLVYKACNVVDEALGRCVGTGAGTTDIGMPDGVREMATRLYGLQARASTAESKLADREADLLRVRTTAHGAAHQLDNIAIEQGWGAGLSPDGIAANIRNCLKARTVAEATLAALRDPDAVPGLIDECMRMSNAGANHVRAILRTALAHATGEKPKGETRESEQKYGASDQSNELAALMTRNAELLSMGDVVGVCYELSRRLDALEARRSP